ncbi:hypothetical protein ACPCVO_49165 [Streptomyces umbrinus]|uniref:hypothetical protein n=1 Tax=Streptomyces umbrinus TaxID=67370 RepID=UPI003C2D082A
MPLEELALSGDLSVREATAQLAVALDENDDDTDEAANWPGGISRENVRPAKRSDPP